MTRRERLMATLQGKPVDRPAVSFYEIGGIRMDPADPSPFNVYNDPSWAPLIRLAEKETDLIRLRTPNYTAAPGNPWHEFYSTETREEGGSRVTRTTLKVGGRVLTQVSRRDREVDTRWTLEHLLKDVDDIDAYLSLPDDLFAATPDVANMVDEEKALGDRGIVMMDTADPICLVAGLFDMADFTVLAMTETARFHRLLEQCARYLQPRVEKVAADFPGRLWRIYGPEYCAEPYLPPRLFKEYVVRYTAPMVKAIQSKGGYARIHCHGRLRAILPLLAEMGASGLDPIEPPQQGDVSLAEVRRDYGAGWILFGNLEASDIENQEPAAFEKTVRRALAEGTAGKGRGFVLMPSASPYGRTITPRTMANYETMVRLVGEFGG